MEARSTRDGVADASQPSHTDRIASARRALIDQLGDSREMRMRKVHLAGLLLKQRPADPETVREAEELLRFSIAEDAARGRWDHTAADAQRLLGFMYRGLSRFDEARAAFRRNYDWRPGNVEAADLLASLLERLGDPDGAQAVRTEHADLLSLAIENLVAWVPASTIPDAAGRYLDLLESTICNRIYGDVSHVSCLPAIFDARRRDVGRDLPTVAHSMIGSRRLHHLRQAVETVLTEGIPGDFLEAGVWRGGACILMRGVLAVHGVPDRRVFVADSFEGLPPPDPRYSKDAATLHLFEMRPELAVGLADVRANFALYDLLDDQVVFVPGWFKDTLPYLATDRLAILRLDGDLYSSTMDVLTALYDRVVPGGFVICDDYGVVVDAQRAVLDFRRARGITEPMFAIDGDGVFWRVGMSPETTVEPAVDAAGS
jgi:O-methyltransferase/8-demethyl-8-(2,3-dimethoxy-alpha-L-rhamnosyl)tetracenomycin-C 4'-O-methyltransferase